MANDTLVWGSWNAICDVCGFKFKSFQLKKRWDGLMVCAQDFEHRHPQDLIKIPKEDTSVPWTRPEPEDIFITVNYVASSVGVQPPPIPDGNFGLSFLELEDDTSFLLLEDNSSRILLA